MKTNWQKIANHLAKDEPMPKTEEYYKKVLAMDDELIHEQKEEIARLKKKINQLQMKLDAKKADVRREIRNEFPG